MPDIIGKAKEAMGKHEDKKAQPGNQVEQKADDAANQKINDAANQQGVPQDMDKGIDDVADQKINSDIPGGN
ncbi:Hypothetical predicted protein [Lecanosticta acicola]|uniref:Uncharacterized protein n=1 Tax=Lecanosticta acicola TaxID=111012 RepID=A0AAI9EAM7_9PEZI|nr:Hypothetical predicted protein [Lecanosticta acicola]